MADFTSMSSELNINYRPQGSNTFQQTALFERFERQFSIYKLFAVFVGDAASVEDIGLEETYRHLKKVVDASKRNEFLGEKLSSVLPHLQVVLSALSTPSKTVRFAKS